MDDFWKIYVFKLNTGRIYLVPVSHTDHKKTYEDMAWEALANKLSRGVDRVKKECKLLHEINGAHNTKIISL